MTVKESVRRVFLTLPNVQYLCDMFVQHLGRMQLYQEPTGVLMLLLSQQDGDASLVWSQRQMLEGFYS